MGDPGKQAFQRVLALGQIAEGRIARWLRGRGLTVIPIYDLEMDTGKGPRIFPPGDGLFIAPDLLCARRGDEKPVFTEAKHKSHWSWHRKTECWTTGIDLEHYEHYQKVKNHFGWDVWLLFLHESDTPHQRDILHGAPDFCPNGLFGGEISVLVNREHHRSKNWGNGGMVYWDELALKKIAPITEC